MEQSIEKLDLRYEGKAKKVWATSREDVYVVEFKDDATAVNARNPGSTRGKAGANNEISARLFAMLEQEGVPTHLLERINDRESAVWAVDIVPIEVVVRNRAAGSFASRYGVEEGLVLDPIVIEWCYRSHELGDPPMNDATAVALGFATPDELEAMFEMTVQVNDLLTPFFESCELELVDFKLEFGTTNQGELLLADEISPDTCRLWHLVSAGRQDEDHVSRDLGDAETYQRVLERLREPVTVLEDTRSRYLESDA